MPAFMYTTLSLKWGWGVYSNIQLVSIIHIFPPGQHDIMHEVNNSYNIMTSRAFLEEWQHCWKCIGTKPRGMVSGNNPYKLVPWFFPHIQVGIIWLLALAITDPSVKLQANKHRKLVYGNVRRMSMTSLRIPLSSSPLTCAIIHVTTSYILITVHAYMWLAVTHPCGHTVPIINYS